MRTAICNEINEDVSILRLQEADLAEPSDDEIQIEVKACSIDFPDILMIQGKYQFKPPMPFAPGGSFAGQVAAIGQNVAGTKVGDRVIAGIRYGGFAEAVNVPAAVVRAIPGSLTYEKAASFSSAYHTAYIALVVRGGLKAGETLLVNGATGGVGMAAVDLGKHMGAHVIATGGTDEKLAVVKSKGADHVINYTMADGSLGGFRTKVKELTDGKGADVIFDPVGGTVFDESMRCINWDGRILAIGFTSGVWPKAAVNHILIKHISVIGVRAGEISRRNPELGKQCRETLYKLLQEGAIDPYVCAAFPLEQAVDALKMLENRQAIGKVVVTMNGYRANTPDHP
ncbi:MAG: NADPH:quinone oxidoreductase [Gammaproteobacteria bacterium]|nr:NADPH:quinone oxidoreductase [Gammaproteobacteria bacterium]